MGSGRRINELVKVIPAYNIHEKALFAPSSPAWREAAGLANLLKAKRLWLLFFGSFRRTPLVLEHQVHLAVDNLNAESAKEHRDDLA